MRTTEVHEGRTYIPIASNGECDFCRHHPVWHVIEWLTSDHMQVCDDCKWRAFS